MSRGTPRSSRDPSFHVLGRTLVRHPWVVIGLWLVLVAVGSPFLTHVSAVTQNSATSLPSNAPSVQASHEIGKLFPNSSSGSTSLIVLRGSQITGPLGERTVLDLTQRISRDPSLVDVEGISSLYTAYQEYLDVEANLALVTLNSSVLGSQSLLELLNQTATLLWGVPATYVDSWMSLVSQNPGTPPSSFNYPVYQDLERTYTGDTAALTVLSLFYNGNTTPPNGFNGTAACAQAPAQVVSCAQNIVHQILGPWALQTPPWSRTPGVDSNVVFCLNFSTFAQWTAIQRCTTGLVGESAGMSPAWLLQVWTTFPRLEASPAQLASWTTNITDAGTPTTYPVPIPSGIWKRFVDSADNVTLIVLTFTVADSFVAPNGSQPVYSDLEQVQSLIPTVLNETGASGQIQVWQTGEAASDLAETQVLNASISFTLPITVGALLLVTLLYFRAPLVPILTFGAIGLALGLSLSGIYLIGSTIGHVDETSVALVTTFVLGVGTDYGVFLLARYREELEQGHPPEEAVVTSVRWAGESIATSGATVILSTLAMALSGSALVSQWGETLSLSVLIALLVALTLIPAFLRLAGPRLFWPHRFPPVRNERNSPPAPSWGTRYFQRAAKTGARRPWAIVAVAVLLSVPLLYVALTAPVSYDYYQQMPASEPSSVGLSVLAGNFGPGFAFPTDVLVTFRSNLTLPGGINTTEFALISQVTGLLNSTPGVREVESPVGPSLAPLSTWANLSTLPPDTRANLLGDLSSYVGRDDRTVWFTVLTNASGLSNNGVQTLDALESRLGTFVTHEPAITSVAYGGASSLIKDLAAQTSLAQEKMEIIVVVGLLVVLLAVLGSGLIPPLALATIAMSIGWAWALTYLVLTVLGGLPIFFFVPTVLFILVFGLGMDYNVFILTRVREERIRGLSSREAVIRAVALTGGIITAAAIILASAFFVLASGSFLLLKSIGFAVGVAVLLDAMFVRTYLVPASLSLLGDRVWKPLPGLKRAVPSEPPASKP